MGYFRRNWYLVAIGAALTPPAVQYAYAERGYAAYGGEWMVLPAVLLAAEMVRAARSAFQELRGYMEDCSEAGMDKKDCAGIRERRLQDQRP